MTTQKPFKPLDINLAAVLAILEQETSSHEDKSDAYSQVTKHMKDDDLSLFDLDLSKHGKQVVTLAIRDIVDDNLKVSQGALQVLGFCLHDKDIVKSLGYPVQTKCLVALQKCISKAEDNVTCTRAMWCIGNQNLNDFIIKGELSKLIKLISKVWNNWTSETTAIDNETAKAVIRLYQQDPDGMKENLGDWAKVTLLSLVRLFPETGINLLNIAEEAFTRDNIDLWSKLVHDEFKKLIGPELKKMMNEKQEVYGLKLWSLYVKILGKELHHGNFINQMLPLVELGFKSINAEVKIEAFRSWKQLIQNFSTDINILSDQKRIKLLMQVFKLNNAKTEPVAIEKFKVWWFFILKLGSKVTLYFDQVCLPLLTFCLGGNQRCTTGIGTPRIQNGVSPVTPHLNLPSNSGSVLPKLDRIQRYAWVVITHYFGNFQTDSDVPQLPNFNIESPSVEFISSPATFLKHSTPLISATMDILNLDFTTEPVLNRVWNGLLGHIRNVLDSGIKSDVKEMFTFFLTEFQTLVLSQTIPVPRLLVLFDAVCQLPRKALSSTAYNISNGEKIHGNPALFLMELVLTPSVLSKSQRSEKYLSIFNNLASVGIENGSGYLEFSQSVLELMSRNREFIKEPDCIWMLWSKLAHILHEQINKTNEINQGDSLEHNFSCMYNILVFPIQQKMTHSVAVPMYKTMVKTWSDLYNTLSRLSALVTTAEPNICCEELCHIILKDVDKNCLLNLNGLDFVAQSCLAMVNCIDFGSIGTTGNFNIGGLSPAKWTKKKQKPLENLHSFVDLICHLNGIFTELTEDFMSSPQKLKSLTRKIDCGSPNLTSILSTIFETISLLYSHVTSSSFLVQLLLRTAESIAGLYKLSGGWSGAAFIKKTEKLTAAICNSIQKQYIGPLDSDFLKILSPFLEATLVYPKRSVSLIAQNLWNLPFIIPLEYPDSLGKVLDTLAKSNKLQVRIPGFVSREEELPASEFTQGDSQAPEPHIPGMPSPNKLRGSFLNKAVSPNIKKSPAKLKEKTPNSAKKKIMPLSDFQNDVFVVIKSPPPKNNPLTEHQIEIFREKRTMPAMYNTLDASQDVSLMAHFNSGDTQSQSQLHKNPAVTTSGKSKNSPCKDNGKQGKSSSENANEGKKHEPRIHGKLNKKKNIPDSDTAVHRQSSTDASNKDIAHFSVIKNMLPQMDSPSTPKSDRSHVNHSSLAGREEDEIDSAHQLLSLSMPRISPTGKSTPTDSQVKEEDYQPSPSQRKLDSWLIRSPSKSKDAPVLPEQILSRTEITQATTCSTKKLRTRKSVTKTEGVSSPMKRTRRASVDQNIKSVKEKKHSQQQKESGELKNSKNDEQIDPEKSKNKGKQEPVIPLVEETLSPKKLKINETVFVKPAIDTREKNTKISPIVAVIEETQSPKKDTRFDTNTVVPVLETPPRPGSSEMISTTSNRKLFSSQDVPIDFCEDSNIIPASPTSNKTLRLGTPVLKLRKLTQDEILQYSPSRKDDQVETSSLTTRRRGRPRKCSDLLPCSSDPSSNKNNDKDLVHFFLHEHDDFSDLKPITLERTEDISNNLSSSEGFDIVSHSNDVNSQEKNCQKESTNISSLSGSESLFTEKESDEYNPCLESTLSDKVVKVKKSKSENDLISKTLDSSKMDIPEILEPSTYNPLLESTLASPDAIGSARKRKQKTPKKLSPESSGPPKRKRRRLSQNSQMTDGSTSMEENEMPSQDSTPKSSRKIKLRGKTADDKPQGKEKLALNMKFETKAPSLADGNSCKPDKSIEDAKSLGVTKLDESNITTTHDNIITVCQVQMNNSVSKEQADALSKKFSDVKKSPMQTDNFMDIDFDDSFTEKNDTNHLSGDKLDKTPESISKQKLEKTPENRSIYDTPTRVSTTKKKKEVAQRRSLSKGKSSIPLDLDAKLEGNENKDMSAYSVTLLEESETESCEVLKSKENILYEEKEKASKDQTVCKTSLYNDTKINLEICSEESEVIPETDPCISHLDCEETLNDVSRDIMYNEDEKEKQNGIKVSDKNESEDKRTVTGSDIILSANDYSQNEELKTNNNENKSKDNLLEEMSGELTTVKSSLEKISSSGLENSRVESSSTDFFMAKEAEEMSESTQNTDKSDKSLNNNKLPTSLNSDSDDNIPLCSLKVNKPESESPGSDVENRSESKESPNNKRRGKNQKTTQHGKIKTSPLSQRLRSSGRTLRTRGKLTRRSTGDMLSLTKTKNAKRQSLEIQKLDEIIDTDKGALVELNKNIKLDEVIVIPSQSQDKTGDLSINSDDKNNKKDGSVPEEIAGPDNLKRFNEMLQDETPRKTPDITSTRKGLRFTEPQSDSKLVTVPRKFEKRSILARRSILKPNIRSQSFDSPSKHKFQHDFHPIKIGHVFAPAASPSAGILKRRRLSGEKATSSPSPPSKQRRVSFAEPLSIAKELNENLERPASPLVTSSSKVSSSLEKFFTSTSESQLTDSVLSKKDSQTSQTQSSYASTQQSQLNTTDAVFPDLTTCSVSVDKILPQLTSSMWARGLGPLIKARNIHTIGDLSSLTEKQVDELPIRSPKVAVVKKVLRKFEEQINPKQYKPVAMEADQKQDEGVEKVQKVVIESRTCSTDLPGEVDIPTDSPDQEIQDILHTGPSDTADSLQSYTPHSGPSNTADSLQSYTAHSGPSNTPDSLQSYTPHSGPSNTPDSLQSYTPHSGPYNTPDSLQSTTPLSSNIIVPGDSLSDNRGNMDLNETKVLKGGSETNFTKEDALVEKDKCPKRQSDEKTNIVTTLQNLIEQCNNDCMKDLKTQDIFEIHQHLSRLTNTVVDTLKERCHSPSKNN